MVDQTIALQVKPLDIATPLMQAAKMRQMESEQQRLTDSDNRDQVASAMRGLAPYADSPEFAGRWTQTIDDLAQRGHVRPDIAARMRDNPSQLQLRSVLAQYEKPDMAFRQQESDRAQSNADRSFKASQEQFGAPTVTNETHNFNGDKTSSVSQRILPGQQPYAAPSAPGSQSATGIPVNEATGEPIQGKELLAYLKKTDPVTAAGVEGIIAGDVNAGGRNLQKTLPLARLVDPSMQQYDYATRSKTALAFGPAGNVGKETKAMNTAFGHANRLSEISKELGGSDFMPGILNPIIQGYKREMNVEGAQKAQKEWETMSGTLAIEVSKALNGGEVAEGERKKWRKVFGEASSPQQREAAISEVMHVLESRMISNSQAWVQGMGPNRAPPAMIYPGNQKIFDRLIGRSNDDTSKPSTKDQSQLPAGPAKLKWTVED